MLLNKKYHDIEKRLFYLTNDFNELKKIKTYENLDIEYLHEKLNRKEFLLNDINNNIKKLKHYLKKKKLS